MIFLTAARLDSLEADWNLAHLQILTKMFVHVLVKYSSDPIIPIYVFWMASYLCMSESKFIEGIISVFNAFPYSIPNFLISSFVYLDLLIKIPLGIYFNFYPKKNVIYPMRLISILPSQDLQNSRIENY